MMKVQKVPAAKLKNVTRIIMFNRNCFMPLYVTVYMSVFEKQRKKNIEDEMWKKVITKLWVKLNSWRPDTVS